MKKFIGVVSFIVVVVMAAGMLLGAVEVKFNPEAPGVASLVSLFSGTSEAGTAGTTVRKDTATAKKAPAKEQSEKEKAEQFFNKVADEYLNAWKTKDFEKAKQVMKPADEKEFMIEWEQYADVVQPYIMKCNSKYQFFFPLEDGKYLGERLYYYVKGEEHGQVTCDFCVWQEDGEWKWEYCGIEPNCLIQKQLVAERIGEGFTNALESGRNSTLISDLLWLNKAYIFSGVVCEVPVYAWQNKDGSVDVGINLMNGKSKMIQYNDITVELIDEKLGRILKKKVNIDTSVMPGMSTVVNIHVKASEVKKGNWSYLNYTTSSNFD